MKYLLLSLLTFSLMACGETNTPAEPDWTTMSWPEIESSARGSQLTMMMWQGDPRINAFMNQFVKPAMQERYGIELQFASGYGNVIVSSLMTEMEAGKSQSELDVVWIDGETFFQLRQINALYGPFVEKLPNAQYIDREKPYIARAFQQESLGYECPWGTVQEALIYDSLRVAEPPMTREALLAWVKAHPGRFTIPTEFTGLNLLKAWLADLAGGRNALDGAFDEELYNTYAPQLWDYLREMKPYLWQEGNTFPNSLSLLHQMFASGEVDFSMSMNDHEVDNKMLEGVFPSTARAFVPDYGTIRNSHYLGIPDRAPHKAAAMILINFLISPEAQYEKRKPSVWADGSILAVDQLSEEWQGKFASLPTESAAPSLQELENRIILEPDPEYLIRLEADFRKEIIE